MEAYASDPCGEVNVFLVTGEDALRDAARRLAMRPRIGLDVESNGLFRYRAGLCTIQLATEDEVFVVDALSKASLDALTPVLGPGGPPKIVHDVAFDARILAEAGLVLANVLDTSIAARMLGRTATGLASLLGTELGITVDKKLQQHDWTERPITPAQLRYLADDVVHLGALADKLWAEARTRGDETAQPIPEAIAAETVYRLAQATAAAGTVDPRPPYVRLKGIDRATKEELSILRRIADVREAKARSLDVPPYKVLGPDVLFAIAKAKPKTMADLERIKGATSGGRARSIARALLEAVAAGVSEGGVIPEDERAMLERPRLPPAVVKARREREARLTGWRRAQAKQRGVDEQVVLPGHCLQDVVDLAPVATLDALGAVPGIGAFRVERDGPAILEALAPAAASSEREPKADEAAR